ncbi:MAG: ATP-binding protein [Akkermansiaceae bacterium]|nr:ATP-binding protein [Akkermansiaceae bacterium]
MDPIRNPFSPGAGSPPPELAGRAQLLDQARILLARIQSGRSEKSMLLTGLRGVGKTVLLNEITRLAEKEGYQTLFIEAHEDKSLVAVLAPQLRSLLFRLDRMEGAKEKVRRGLAVLKGFVGSIKVTFDDIPVGIDIESEKGSADSGDIEIDLPDLLMVVAEAAQDRKTAVAILIDEIQYFGERELSALIMAMHRMQQRRLPLVLIGAGLPILPRLAGESKSYAERLFQFPIVGPLPPNDAAKAITEPIEREGEKIDPAAIGEILRLAQGYPYFLQEWGYQAWNRADASPILESVINNATSDTIRRLDENFFRVRYDRLTPSEKNLLRAMAQLGAGPCRVGDVADLLGVKVGSLSPRRASLIKKGMIYSPTHGDLAFTVPLFDEFMRRVIPSFPIS